MHLPLVLYEQMLAHASSCAPQEACGLVGGRGDRAERFFPTSNGADDPVRRYDIPARELIRVMREIDAAGLELLAIFHSHPATEAYPSATDIRLAYYPDAFYLIMSLADPERPVLRAFRIIDGAVGESPLQIV